MIHHEIGYFSLSSRYAFLCPDIYLVQIDPNLSSNSLGAAKYTCSRASRAEPSSRAEPNQIKIKSTYNDKSTSQNSNPRHNPFVNYKFKHKFITH